MSATIRPLVFSLVLFTAASPAYAYLDPGTGSMILQGVIAGLAVASLTIRTYWYRLKSLFTKKPEAGAAQNPPKSTQSSDNN
ncbi:MAG: hypothetical protein RQ899_07975 [Pseudomonadales bacterium]|nr:hypothetical protein [Pseudomonadales bacterium]